jgi:septation ring formation regulator EzrA
MPPYAIISIIFAAFGCVTSIIGYVVGLRVKADILENNEKFDIKITLLDKRLYELQTEFTDKVLRLTNGKYLTTAVYEEYTRSVSDKFSSIRDLLDVSMEKIDNQITTQISDLKDRMYNPGVRHDG